MVPTRWILLAIAGLFWTATPTGAAELSGVIRDETGGALPGVVVELRRDGAEPMTTFSDARAAIAAT